MHRKRMIIRMSHLTCCYVFLCSYAADEIHFNLMAIVSDRKKLYEKQIAEAEQRRELAAKKVDMIIPKLLLWLMG